MIRILITGICGKMGENLMNCVGADGDAEVVCGVDPAGGSPHGVAVYPDFTKVPRQPDVIVDFSSPAALGGELAYAAERGVPLVIAATGYTQEQLEEIKAASLRTAIFRSANFSIGVNLLAKLIKEAALALGEGFDVEICERHHRYKADAPSGTALLLAESANAAYGNSRPLKMGRNGIEGKRGNEIGIHSLRGGTIVGEHEVMFAGEDEIITLSHSARSKAVFASGALKAAKWLCGKPAGMYGMDDLLNS